MLELLEVSLVDVLDVVGECLEFGRVRFVDVLEVLKA
jgi:hypothetical protein